MAELEWHRGSEVEWWEEPGAEQVFVAKVPWRGRTKYYEVRPVKEGWMIVEYPYSDLDTSFSLGTYSTIEAAKAVADDRENGPPSDPSVLLQLIEWAKEAGEQGVADRCQAEYDANHKRGPSR